MWRKAYLSGKLTNKMPGCLSPFLLLLLVSGVEKFVANAEVVHSEGGSFYRSVPDQSYSRYGQEPLMGDNELSQWGEAQREDQTPIDDYTISVELLTPQSVTEQELVDFLNRQSEESPYETEELEKLGEQINKLSKSPKGYDANQEYDQVPLVVVDDEEVVNHKKSTGDTAETPSVPQQHHHGKPKKQNYKPRTTPQKKGQSEFVEFVEPVDSSMKQSKKEVYEKRAADFSGTNFNGNQGFWMVPASGNVVFIAIFTICSLLTVGGMVGGAYYFKNVRSVRHDPFDDFTHYSPARPGKQLKKGKNPSPSNFMVERGDESLAYRAQLHQYQQNKQKIIGSGAEGGSSAVGFGGCGVVDDIASDKSDDDVDLEHNFSVYECPGLAPTADIEVKNPNFVESSTKKKHSNN